MTPAEAAVIADLLHTDGGSLHEISLSPRDFSTPKGEVVFGLIQDVVASGAPATPAVVSDWTRKLDEAGRRILSPASVWEMTGGFPASGSVTHHAGIVARDAARRRFVMLTASLNQRAQEGGDVETLASEAAESLDKVTSGLGSVIRPVAETIDETLDSLDGPTTYMETPWENLNHIINGWKPSGLYVIGARPSVGKTVAGLQAALSLCNTGPVAFTSLEMSSSELELRMVAQEARVDMGRINRKQLTNAEWQSVAEKRDRWGKLPLFIDPSHDPTVAQVARHAWSVKRKHGLTAVVVDYLQLMESVDSRKEEYATVTESSRKLKLLAMALEVPVIALSQLNRKSENRDGKVPQLSDLRSSGAVEQDANVVILMHRDLQQSPHEAELIVAKNRSGPTGTAEVDFVGHHAYMRDRRIEIRPSWADAS